MGGPESFFLTLTSDTQHYLGVQEASNFRTILSKPLKLDPLKYEVGLVEIIYPNTLVNVHDADFIVMYPSGLRTEERHGRIDDCRVDSVEEMVELMNRQINRALPHGHNRKIKLELESGRVNAKIDQGYCLVLKRSLSTILGYGNYRRSFIVHEYSSTSFVQRDGVRGDMAFHEGKAPGTVDINRNLMNLFVYVDFVEHQLVGHTQIPLLRIVPTKSTMDSAVTITYPTPHYINLIREDLTSVHVQVTDASGTDIKFHSGKLVLKLHFKLKNANL